MVCIHRRLIGRTPGNQPSTTSTIGLALYFAAPLFLLFIHATRFFVHAFPRCDLSPSPGTRPSSGSLQHHPPVSCFLVHPYATRYFKSFNSTNFLAIVHIRTPVHPWSLLGSCSCSPRFRCSLRDKVPSSPSTRPNLYRDCPYLGIGSSLSHSSYLGSSIDNRIYPKSLEPTHPIPTSGHGSPMGLYGTIRSLPATGLQVQVRFRLRLQVLSSSSSETSSRSASTAARNPIIDSERSRSSRVAISSRLCPLFRSPLCFRGCM
ncbi:hypothetical protein BDN72DRAFT_162852 [Pluteus cervinus]|uniref:Uncharacterized protein n=1 Tax=Pluteus cervinus TaxID=181527 RepID=A0ACD3AK05_9AGAR|nr:hypothetical protein BDN72DRAFT_162852 [Pluteus cervinus]